MTLRFDGSLDEVWAGLARHGRPIQYAHMTTPLALWDVWTPIAGLPAAFEPPSASFALDWGSIRAMRERGIGFATITLAAGISSTGDPELDRRLPFDEPYRISEATAAAIRGARAAGGRVVAIGTTVVRALEHAGARRGWCARVRGWRISGWAQPAVCASSMPSSRAPTSRTAVTINYCARSWTTPRSPKQRAALEARGYRTHEFGDSVLIEKQRVAHRSGISRREEPVAGPVALQRLARPDRPHQARPRVACCSEQQMSDLVCDRAPEQGVGSGA